MARPLGHHPLPRVREHAPLADAPDQRRPQPARRFSRHREQPIRRDRLALALELERSELLDGDRVARQQPRLPTEQDLPRPGRLLEPRRDIDRVAAHERLGALNDLAGVDADPRLDPQLRQRLPHLDRCPQRPQRVVFVQHRHPEHRHDRVADELLHRPSMPLDDRAHSLEIARHHAPHRLRIA